MKSLELEGTPLISFGIPHGFTSISTNQTCQKPATPTHAWNWRYPPWVSCHYHKPNKKKKKTPSHGYPNPNQNPPPNLSSGTMGLLPWKIPKSQPKNKKQKRKLGAQKYPTPHQTPAPPNLPTFPGTPPPPTPTPTPPPAPPTTSPARSPWRPALAWSPGSWICCCCPPWRWTCAAAAAARAWAPRSGERIRSGGERRERKRRERGSPFLGAKPGDWVGAFHLPLKKTQDCS